MTEESKIISEILYLYLHTGEQRFEETGVTHLRHGEQSAYLASQANASDELIIASLMHDIGHLLDPTHIPFHYNGIDRQHEIIGAGYLRRLFPLGVSEPVRLHVLAKRYLYSIEEGYTGRFKQDAQVSLQVQGGKMTADELKEFKRQEYCTDAVQLRKWDDEASHYLDYPIPPITSYRPLIEKLLRKSRA